MEIENPKLDMESLSLLESKIISNTAEVKDYKKLETFISSFGLPKDYLLKLFKDKGIFSYEQYIQERKNTTTTKNSDLEGILLGYVLGIVKALKDYVSKNNL